MSGKLQRTVSILLAAALLIPSAWFAPTARAETPEIPVILFHRVVETAVNEWTDISTSEFKRMMQYLDAQGYTTLTSEQYVNIMDGSANPADIPAKPVLLTFDDGTPDFIDNALPILDEYGMNAVLFVVTGWIDGGYSMSAAQLQSLADHHPNVSIENHTVHHAEDVWNKMSQAEAEAELAQANAHLESITGKAPLLMAYPYGHYHAEVEAAVEAVGIKYAFKVGYPNAGDYAMGRHYVFPDTTVNDLANWVGGPAPTVTVYEEAFTSGVGAAIQSGDANVQHVTGKVFDGNADGGAIYVSNRVNNWDAVDFHFNDIGLADGKTYTVTLSVYADTDVTVPEGAQVWLQTVDSYSWLAGADVQPGSAATLTGKFTVNTGADRALRVQSNEAGAAVPFYIGDIRITGEVTEGGEEENRPPALDFATITFEDQTTGGFEARGGTEVLTVTNEANHTEDGSYSLKVEGRTDTWHGPSLRVEPYIDLGHEYRISLWVKLIEPSTTELQLSTQVGSGDSGASYNNITSTLISASDGWVQLEGTYRYTSAGGEYVTIYVESSSSATASFYIDDIRFESTGSGPVDIEKDLVPIKDAYQDHFLIGNIVSAADLEGIRLELLKLHHNVATAENAMKPDQAYDDNGQFDFTAEDAIVDKVLAEGMKMVGHVLVWHQQTPTWLHTKDDQPLSREEALAHLRTHVKTVMEHFGDRVIAWDVVNEAMNDNPPEPNDWQASLRQSGWYQAIGPDYVEQAFIAAREVLDAHPEWDVKLYYNDYNQDNQNKSRAIYHMVKELNEKYAAAHSGKLLIDGIGMQGHFNINTNPENVRLSLERYSSLGVEISITELDLTAGSNGQLSDKLADAQGYLYAQLFSLFKEYSDHIVRVTIWGLNDATSWRAEQTPLLFDANLQAKPAYYAVINPEKFISEYTPEEREAKQSTAYYGTPVIDGEKDAIWNQTVEIPINQYQTAWQGASGIAKVLWDRNNLYVLIEVSDEQLDKSHVDAYQQDSVEIFLDQNNGKSPFYQEDDGQYRVNFDNEASFNPAGIAAGFESATKVVGSNYTVEVKIPLTAISPANNKKIGFDAQINDAKDGARQSVAAWNDTTGTAYQDTSVLGVLTLIGQRTSGGGGGSGGGTGSQPEAVEQEDGVVSITPSIQLDNGRVKAAFSLELLNDAIAQVDADASGTKRIVITLPEEAGTSAFDVELPAQSVNGEHPIVLLIQTAHATIEIPGNMLAHLTDNTEPVSIQIDVDAANTLDASLREQIGDRPVIKLNVAVGGSILAWDNPEAPVTVTIPYAPTPEELVKPDHILVWYVDGEGQVSTVSNSRYDEGKQAVIFQTTHFSTFAVTSVFKTFEDLQRVPWAEAAIEVLASREIIQGTDDERYSPSASVSRDDYTASLVRMLELEGTDEAATLFEDSQPNSAISREDAMVLAVRALHAAGKRVEAGGSLHAFADAADISNSAVDSVARLVKSGIVVGSNGRLEPQAALSRAQAAVMLYAIWENSVR